MRFLFILALFANTAYSQSRVLLLSCHTEATRVLSHSLERSTSAKVVQHRIALTTPSHHVDNYENPVIESADVLPEKSESNNYSALLVITVHPYAYFTTHSKKRRRLKQREIEKTMEAYLKILTFYDEFKGLKKIIYYEDLLAHPQKTLDDVATILSKCCVIDYAVADFVQKERNQLFESEAKRFLASRRTNHKTWNVVRHYLMNKHAVLFRKYLQHYY